MNVQQSVPQKKKTNTAIVRKHSWIGLFLLAGLRRLIYWIWTILIVGTVVGFIGNAVFTYFSSGALNFKDPRTLTVLSWFNTHFVIWIPTFAFTLVLTVCSYLASRWQYHMERTSQQVYDQSLITIATGVQRSLDELNTKRTVSYPPFATLAELVIHEEPLTSQLGIFPTVATLSSVDVNSCYRVCALISLLAGLRL
jgi:hypothetical protein